MNDVAWALQTARGVGPVHPPHAHAHPIHKLHTGPLHSTVAGRTDHLPSNVPNGSYVLPADIVSAMGEGNTMAGFKVAKRMFEGARRHFGGMPYAGDGGPYGQGATPYGMASGGNVGSNKSLYVNRSLTNAEQVSDWFKRNGYKTCLPKEMHVTICYSKSPVNWSRFVRKTNRLETSPPIKMAKFGDSIVMLIDSHLLNSEYETFIRGGASHDFDEYRPHVTIGEGDLPKGLKPYPDKLIFGPQDFDLVKDDRDGLASGGQTDGVPVAVAGGEHVLAPHEVAHAGLGDMDAGHRALDEFVLRQRANTVKTLRGLPGPKRGDE